ncbi:alpha-1,4-glucan--maltose-1-phosphate maltosyltransferase [Puniceicoccus vermicola]|uniref:Alpha-1,4-glucan:maltose-1-phosphate maltosyltransferase n=1 Tax=Puniceicoccus vermicola TaxID=388746 RepID=A0A7X1B441_9BACT|nr:alpha-1,4-glucan--maltose-1-phosphate maltosyltransferase [Puniceicoccus vermicola]MBC2604153.1 alpha-1,4-glucan--maltose-1-phosphate maltosyltransferase [Puniceicoccus vermicola]
MTPTDPLASGANRVIIENVEPSCDHGLFPVKTIIGEPVEVSAHIFTDGHDTIRAVFRYRLINTETWAEIPLEQQPNDEWSTRIFPEVIGIHEFSVAAWVDPFFSWQNGFRKKVDSAQPLNVEIEIGIDLIEDLQNRANSSSRDALRQMASLLREPGVPMGEKIHLLLGDELTDLARDFPDRRHETVLPSREIWVERKRAAFSSWYEFFPRSWAKTPGQHGTFDEAQPMLENVASLGFNVVYLPPIHPIGHTHRKGKNNSLEATPTDVGSPWAIGSKKGGHKDIHPALGSLKSFRDFIWKAGELGMEVAMDIAFQCSPDHPYVNEHPEWFKWRPDGTVQFAENPPKKYEDIIPFDFECETWRELWDELKSVLVHWIECGVRVFRIDNPHTKPFEFWRWAIREIKTQYPDVLFLAEAFTRPKLKYRLGKSGFTHGYTYFTWRNTKEELEGYMKELCAPERQRTFWPNFWPNTPDILPEVLQYGGRPAFVQRLILAATLSSNYGMYGPAFEQCVHEAFPGKEEYNFSEKYEIKQWDLSAPGNLRPIIRRINHIRRDHAALQRTFNIRFVETDNPQLIAFIKHDPSGLDIILTVVNLDPYNEQSGWIVLPLEEYGVDSTHPFLVQDLLPEPDGDMPRANYLWNGPRNFIKLNPHVCPAHIFRIFRKQRHEEDFDYWL